MGIEIKPRTYEFNLTDMAGGAVGAFAAHRVASSVTRSTGLAVVADATGATVGGKLTRIPSFLGSVLGSAGARQAGGNGTAAALSAHLAGKAAAAAPHAERALGEIADGSGNAIARGAAKVGETALHEAPGAIGATLGAKGANTLARALVWGVAMPLGAILGATITGAVAPEVSWSND
jgi:hypothetical protein